MGVQLGPHGITVNSVSPGIVRTQLSEALMSGWSEEGIRASIPVGHTGVPEDIAEAVLFQVGPGGSFTNATDLVVDGGLSSTWRIAP